MNRSLWSSPKDFSYQGKTDKSLELCNSLYGSSRKRGSATSRQAAIVREGAFTDGGADKCLYDERMFYILLYINDLFMTGAIPEITETARKELSK